MKIAFVSPKGPLYRHKVGIFRKTLRACPLTFSTLSSLVPEELDAEIKIIDEGVEDLPVKLQADLIGMTVLTGSAPRAYELAKKFRQEGMTVVLGGPHVTLMPEEAQQHADAIVVGYAEESWPQLLRDFAQGRMRPRYDMDPAFSFHRMPQIPFPRRDLMRRKGYRTIHTFEATRGCVHDCEFCVVPAAWGRKPFQKPIDHIVADIQQMKSKRLLFYDLNLIADKQYAKDLFRALIPLKIQWFGLSTVLLAEDPELLDLVARSGCKGVLIGFESVSKSALKASNKSFNRPEKYGDLVRNLHSLGIAINGTFVFGNDTDTKETFDEVRDFVLEHRIDLPRFSVLTPFPGTALYARLQAEGRILTRDWSLYDGQHVVFQPKHLTARELIDGHERTWREIYSWRSIGRRNLQKMGDRLSSLPLLLGANIAYRYYARNLSRFYTCNGGLI